MTFIKHTVEQAGDWSEWVCPDPQSYLMKCCDCGLVHEAQFGVVRYASEAEHEDCERVDDPNLQAVFRMRRHEQPAQQQYSATSDHRLMQEPAQRTWVGLTDEEQTQVAWSCGAMSVDWLDFARAIEAKLKEKNT